MSHYPERAIVKWRSEDRTIKILAYNSGLCELYFHDQLVMPRTTFKCVCKYLWAEFMNL